MKSRAIQIAAVLVLLGAYLLPGGDAGAVIGNKRKFGFGLQSVCTRCHGLPPIPADDISAVDALEGLPGVVSTCAELELSTSDYRCENYPGGGGAHFLHVELLRKQLGIGVGELSLATCTPCHGANPGGDDWHLDSGTPCGWDWPSVNGFWQEAVDIVDASGNFGTGTAGPARYTGGATPDTSQAVPTQAQAVTAGFGARGGEPQQCSNLNCHGPGASYNASPFNAEVGGLNSITADGLEYTHDGTNIDRFVVNTTPDHTNMRLLWDFTTGSYDTDTSTSPAAACGNANWGTTPYPAANSIFDPFGRDIACAGCHGSTAPDAVTQGAAGEPRTQIDIDTYSSSIGAQGATASYFGTVSDYARGGHGDTEIQDEDPAPGVGNRQDAAGTVLHCSACHDDTVGHGFDTTAIPGTNPHRLDTGLLGSRGIEDLCNSCHSQNHYPGATNGTFPDYTHHPSYQRLFPSVLDIEPASGQEIFTTYDASGAPNDVDFFVDFWNGDPGNGNQTPEPTPTPTPVLPLEAYPPASPTRVMCVTCHNPHGTDLFTFDILGTGQTIPDNNMLRLRDSDDALCVACH